MTETAAGPVVAIVQARMGSSRLPGKSLASIAGRTALDLVIDAARRARSVDAVWVATTVADRDDPIVAAAERAGVPVYRGSEEDVLRRYVEAAEHASAATVVRLTADCPLLVPEAIDAVVAALAQGGVDLATNAPPTGRTWPDGMDAEAFASLALRALDASTDDRGLREHVTLGFHRDPRWRVRVVDHEPDLGDLRITVDTTDDLELVRDILEELLARTAALSLADVIAALDARGLISTRQ